jgi:DNA-binding winged helix-turn-helix (wHTH) protein
MRDVTNCRYRFDNVEVDAQNLRVTVGSEIRPLEPKSFRLLLLLVENPGRVLTKEEIMAMVWSDAVVSDNSLARAVTQIRKVLEDDPKAPRYIETVPTVGYRFVGEITPQDDPFEVSAKSAGVTRPRSRKLAYFTGASLALTAAVVWWVAAAGGSSVPYPLHVTRVSKLTSWATNGNRRFPRMAPMWRFRGLARRMIITTFMLYRRLGSRRFV